MLSTAEIKKRAIEFSRDHADDSDEKSQSQSFWHDFFSIWGLSPQRIGVFESRARTLKGTVGFIDFFWPGTLLVEQKSLGKDLDAAMKQALDYCSSGGLKDTEIPRYIIVSDFSQFRILELENGAEFRFLLKDLQENLHRFNFILGYEQRVYKDEDPVNIKAAELMGALHDALKENGFQGHDLELFLVRLMFCFFADDTGIFEKDQFAFLVENRTREDGSDLGPALSQIFQTLNTATENRMKSLDPEFAALPYVNGGLFEEALPVPSFTKAMRSVFLHCCLFNWSSVSPAVFGSLFQTVMDEEARRNLGAHYTSEKNILKTIHGLFLDDLRLEYKKAAGALPKLHALLKKISSLRFLDPACGCGNFLVLAYRELRLLEIDIHKEIQRITKNKYLDISLYRGIDVDAMFGIEIEEFPAQIARTALWIMDHLMNKRLSDEFGEYIVRLPLSSTPHIVNGNALRMDWRDLSKPDALSYILGNPPFIGKQHRNSEQVQDMDLVFSGIETPSGILDYVTAWYIKAADFIAGTGIRCAFVSTNSITQGEQVPALWAPLFSRGIHISFAHRTFKWSNEARGNAAVFCVIIGFRQGTEGKKRLFDYHDIAGEPSEHSVENITPYLTSGNDIFVASRTDAICPSPPIAFGNMPNDDGNLLFTDEEKRQFTKQDPDSKSFFRPLMCAREFLHNEKRWCLWLKDVPPSELKNHHAVMERIEKVRTYRQASNRAATVRLAAFPALFGEIRQPDADYILVPAHSSEGRDVIPFGFCNKNQIGHNSCLMITEASPYHFGVLQSAMHMAWMRQVCGRLEGRYRYSNNIVYNNFSWPQSPSDDRRKAVEKAASMVLEARADNQESSLADLYDPRTMPAKLVRAHRSLDAAVDKCYRTTAFKSELERVEYLFSLYEKYTSALTAEAVPQKNSKKKRSSK